MAISDLLILTFPSHLVLSLIVTYIKSVV